MHVHFTNKPLDQTQADIFVIGCFAEERPLRGVAGLIDWRLYGFVSKAIQENNFSPYKGERLLVPASPQLNCRWILFQGLGSSLETDAKRVHEYAKEALNAASKLKCRSCAIFYPDLLTTAQYQQNALRWLLEGMSLAAASMPDQASIDIMKIFIPSSHEEEIDLSKAMLSKLLARHSINLNSPTTSRA